MTDTTLGPRALEKGRNKPSDELLGGREAAAGLDTIHTHEPDGHLQSGAECAQGPRGVATHHNTEFCLLAPRQFNDTQQIADGFRADAVVICNMQGCETALARRLTDFCSGLTYALDGTLRRLDDKVLLLTPRDVGLSSEAAADGLEDGGFAST